ncbi:MAG: adenylate/guanylate cyclase domain-containing protein [Erythrobacter sp.]|nr:adenylate/guanylate cyclase domain-containing protein [Erythrobacter sp.]
MAECLKLSDGGATLAETGNAAASQAERRPVSVLFADMAGFTAAIERLGEEKALPFVRAIHDILTKSVRDHGGSVRSYAGDGIMAVFGIPDSQEDDALHACRAAFAIHAAFAKAGDDFEARYGERPMIRAGISSGMAVIAAVEGDNAALTAVGDAVNLASRLQSLAQPGGCVICEATRRLVEWLVDMSFEGEHEIKGRSKPQKLWRVIAIREGASRFDASLGQGLTPYIGRQAELLTLRAALAEVRDGGRAIDIVAEPGLGKTRLVFEFVNGLGDSVNTVLTGHCASNGGQTPFLPFLEVVREAFRIRPEDEPSEIGLKIKTGLATTALDSVEHQALLLNLLGLEAPDAWLAGLDGVLIGLRTRELLLALLNSACRAGPVVMLIEDAHWIDSASEELLNTLIQDGVQPNLLILLTRRPAYTPRWVGKPKVLTLLLEPLGPDAIRTLAETRLGVKSLPDDLVQEVTERAGGNPLFGEEILRFLIDKGALRVEAGKADFAAVTGESELPVTMQGLLTARTDALLPQDRAMLEAAAVIGRRFDPGLLALVVESPADVGAALLRLQEQHLIYREAKSSSYVFRHILMRDSVYQRLLNAKQTELHLKIAEAQEKRSEGRLAEVADMLAYHYSHTDRVGPTFTFLVMAGTRSLGVFSLDEAERYFSNALEIYERDPSCTSDERFSEFVANYGLCCNISLRLTAIIALAQKALPILARIGDNHHHALFLHHYALCLVWAARYLDALRVRKELSAMAARLGNPLTSAYALVAELTVSTYCAPMPNDEYRTKCVEAEAELAKIDDAYLTNLYFCIDAYDAMARGRVAEALAAAERAIEFGSSTNDPRGQGFGLAMKALVAVTCDDYEPALDWTEQAISVSRAEFEKTIAETSKVSVLVALNRPGAGERIQRWVTGCEERDWGLFALGPECWLAVAMVTAGRIDEGLRSIETTIAHREAEGFMAAADWSRLYLCEIYLAIMSGEGEASLSVLVRNFRALARVLLFGAGRIEALVAQVRTNPQFDPEGHYIARAEMILGLLYKRKKQRAKAAMHLTEARRIFQMGGPSAILTRIETALAEVSAA